MFDRRVVRGNTYAARILPADIALTDKKATGTLWVDILLRGWLC
jgi:hypothetical protein